MSNLSLKSFCNCITLCIYVINFNKIQNDGIENWYQISPKLQSQKVSVNRASFISYLVTIKNSEKKSNATIPTWQVL